ncbi:MAG: hypothetical protein AB7N76_17060 [Planctomycetota bacterium]
MRETGWSWKVEDREQNPELNLRYEPGSWGDLFKGAWAVAVAEALLAARGGPLRLLDPFAGAPDYPLVPVSAARLEALPAPRLLELLAAHRVRGRLPSTARLVLDAWGEAAGAAAVFDKDPLRLQAWRRSGAAEALSLADGEEALRPPVGAGPDLLLVDPYDLFTRHELLERGLAAAPEGAVLYYLFNKSPRAVKAHRTYVELRARLARALARDGRSLLVGRVPSDAVLPRAWHELLVVAPQPLADALRAPLRQLAQDLAARLCVEGAFEG